MPRSNTRASATKPEALAEPDEVAAVLRVERHTLDNWRAQGRGPDYVKVGKNVCYRWSAVNEWLASREVKIAEAV